MRGPFDFEHADPWSSQIVDVESLNAHVSDAVLEQIEEVRRAAPGGPRELRSSTLLALGPAGSGKTHLFLRIRRKAGTGAAFVLVRPEIGVEPTLRHILTQIVDSLQHPASDTTDRQIDIVAAKMLARVASDRVGPHVLLEQFRERDEPLREDLIERVTAELESLYPEIWTDYLERLLRAPFLPAPDRRAAHAWLAGREMNDVQLSRLGGGASLTDADILPALKTLAIVAAHGAPIVLVFDQLENLVTADAQTQRIAAHGNLVCELHDSVRGLVIVQMALDAEWDRRIRPALASSHRSRVEARLVELHMPSAAERRELVRRWLERLAPSERPEPFPWPFSPELIERWCSAPAMTPRMLMIACREAFSAPLGALTAPDVEQGSAGNDERLGELFDGYVKKCRQELDAVALEGRGTDAERLAGALMVTGELAGLEPWTRADRITRVVGFRKSGREVRIVQHAHPRSVAAALQHAAASEHVARTVVLREHELGFSPTWLKVEEYARELETHGASLVWLGRDDAARLLALHDFLAAGRSQDLAGVDGRPLDFAIIERWVQEALGWREWPAVSHVVLEHAPATDVAPTPAARPKRSGGPPASSAAPSPALVALRRLRVASLERIVREVRHVDATATRQSVSDDLSRAGRSIRWYGHRLLAWVEPEASDVVEEAGR